MPGSGHLRPVRIGNLTGQHTCGKQRSAGELHCVTVKKVVVLVFVLLIFVVPLAIFAARSATPVLALPSSLTSLGQATPINLSVRDPHGVRSVHAYIEQNGTRYQVFENTQPTESPEQSWDFTAG